MITNFDSVLKLVLQEEGGFYDDPRDADSITNLGITKRIWEAYVGHEVDKSTMRKLTGADVAPLYRLNYWNRVHGDDLPAGVDYVVMDFAVKSGTSRAAKTLQRACGVEDDGFIDPESVQVIQGADPRELIEAVCAHRLAFLFSLPSYTAFGKGWVSRIERVRTAARQMLEPRVMSAEQGRL
jgi:lysozyme family protein